jgi:5-oxoprolinase (ATP-hydrolysing)
VAYFANGLKVANSYVKPSVSLYLSNLLKSLQGKTKHLRILRSDGGLSSVSLASKFPVSMALSGPAGGVSGVVSVVATQTKYKNLITVDMGVRVPSFVADTVDTYSYLHGYRVLQPMLPL